MQHRYQQMDHIAIMVLFTRFTLSVTSRHLYIYRVHKLQRFFTMFSSDFAIDFTTVNVNLKKKHIFKRLFKIFLKFSKSVKMLPDLPERIRTHPNGSEQVRTGPSKSENLEKLAKTSKN